jgi:hypothetical protein
MCNNLNALVFRSFFVEVKKKKSFSKNMSIFFSWKAREFFDRNIIFGIMCTNKKNEKRGGRQF